jgi:hypothetical protein
MSKSPSGNRRQFLLGAGAASVATVAAVVSTVKPAAVVKPGAKVRADSGRGYELTEHIRNYYRTTAV